jgi:glutaredoxin
MFLIWRNAMSFKSSFYLAGLSATLTVALIAACAFHAADAQTNLYRWVDKNGKVHFSDQPPPVNESKNVQQKRVQGNVIEIDKLPFATRDAMKKNPVTLYTSAQCTDLCAQSRTLLTNRGIPYTEKVVDKDPKIQAELTKVAGEMSVPALTIGGNTIKGLDTAQWNNGLDSAGYPRTNANVGEVKPTVIEGDAPRVATAPAKAADDAKK